MKQIIIAITLLSIAVGFAVAQAPDQTIVMNDADTLAVVCYDMSLDAPPGDTIYITCNQAQPPPVSTAVPTIAPSPTPTSAAVPTATPTVAGATPLPTPTNTAVYLPTVTGSPTATSSATGIGVIGDSASYPYEYIGRGGADSFSWVEMVHSLRGADFGPYLAGNSYNRAYSGNKSLNIPGQAAGLQGYIQSGLLRVILIYIGANDTKLVCDTAQTAAQINTIHNDMVSYAALGIDNLIGYGMPAGNIYMVTQADRGQQVYCSNGQQLTALVNSVNVDLTAVANQRGAHMIDASNIFTELAGYVINGSGDIRIDGETVFNQACDLPTCLVVADGHPNTAANGIMFNALFTGALGYAPLTDNEIAIMAGLK